MKSLLPLLLLLVAIGASAQDLPRPTPDSRRSAFTTEGREFWVVFQKNFRDFVTNEKTQAQEKAAPLELELFITSNKSTTVTIEIRGLGYKKEFQVRAGRVLNVEIDTAVQIRSSEKIEDLAVHIVADEPVAVYGLNRRYQTTDTYLAYPVNVLGKEYRAMGYRWLQNDLLSQLAIIATENNTQVKVTPSVKTQKGRPAGVPFTVELNRGDVYQIIPKWEPNSVSDLTGTLIESNKPVAVFSGHNCAYVPNISTKACNLLVEQLPSLQSWGRQFFVGTLAGRSSAVIRVLATNDNTQVFENGKLVVTLRSGEFYENTNQTAHTLITASQPVLVAQYSKGFDNGDNVGDPMMIIVAPTEQFLASYRFATPVRGSWHHYINVITPTSTIGSMRLDGRPVDRTLFKQFGLSRYSIGQVQVPYGTHVIEGPEPFGLYSYGFGYDESSYDAYGNGGGQSMDIVVELPDTMAPTMDVRRDAGMLTITAIARDDRVNDRGLAEITPIDYDNFIVTVPRFEPGTPLVAIPLATRVPRQNAYALFRLRDRAGNYSYYTICVKYADPGDSLQITVLTGGASCDFAPKMMIGAALKYSVLDNNVTIAQGSDPLNNPVELNGNQGQPVWGIGTHVEYPWQGSFQLTARAGIDLFTADAFGYWPDSLEPRANDGTSVVEEFHLDRVSALLTLGGGIEYYFVERHAYLLGLLNLSVPLYTNETFTRTILSPSNYVYPNGEGTQQRYNGTGPSGLAIAVTPELALGASVDLRFGWRVFGELGGGYSLTSIAPERDWNVSYLFARFGARIRI